MQAAMLLAAAPAAQAYSFLYDYDEVQTVAQGLERIKGAPERHLLIYFGMPKSCPPCNYTRNLLNGSDLRRLYKPNYVVINVDIVTPSPQHKPIVEKSGVRWAPVLSFLDASGKRVAFAKQLRNEKEAVLLNEYVSRKLYLKTRFQDYYAANFNASGPERTMPQTALAKAPVKIDDRPRLRDVLGQKHERVLGEELRKLLPGQRMVKENQDWVLTMDLAPDGKLAASGKRKDGKGEMRGPGNWYVTKKGKMCIEVKSSGLDETWCRHVFRVGENYYYATKDLREKSLAYRFTLERA